VGFWVADDLSAAPGTWNSRCNSSTLTGHGTLTLLTNAMGTHKALEEDGTTAYLQSNVSANPTVVVALVRVTSAVTTAELLGSNSASSASGNYYFQIFSGNNGASIFYNASGGGVFAQTSNIYYPPSNRFWMYTVTANLAANNLVANVGVNRAPMATDGQSAAQTVFLPSGNFVVGAGLNNSSVTDFCPCDIAALWVGTAAATATPVSAIQQWMVNNLMGPDQTFMAVGFNHQAINYSFPITARTSNGTWTAGAWSNTDSTRDPDIRYVPANGKWWQVSTNTEGGAASNGQSFDLEWSLDGHIWNYQGQITCGAGTVGSCWAPGMFIDAAGSMHVVAAWDAAEVDSAHVLEGTHPTTADPSGSWTSLVPLNGTFPPNAIDPWIFQRGSTFHLLFKDETSKYIDHAICTDTVANCLDNGVGAWTVIQTDAAMGLPQFVEGPFTLATPTGTGLRIFVDGTPGAAAGYLWADCTWSGNNLSCGSTTAMSSPAATAYSANTGYWQHGVAWRTPSPAFSFMQ
jgi:hypothetical protein